MNLSKEKRKYYRRLFSHSDSFVLAGWMKNCLDDLDEKDKEIEALKAEIAALEISHANLARQLLTMETLKKEVKRLKKVRPLKQWNYDRDERASR